MPKNSRRNRKLHPVTKKEKAVATAAAASQKAANNALERKYGIKIKGGKSRSRSRSRSSRSRSTRKTKHRQGGQIVGFNSHANPVYYQ